MGRAGALTVVRVEAMIEAMAAVRVVVRTGDQVVVRARALVLELGLVPPDSGLSYLIRHQRKFKRLFEATPTSSFTFRRLQAPSDVSISIESPS